MHFQGELQLIARVNKQKINKNSGHYDIGLLHELHAKHHYECTTMVPPVYLTVLKVTRKIVPYISSNLIL